MPIFKVDVRLLGLVVLAYLLAAYLLVPALWRRHERLPSLAGRPLVTRTAADIPGDPLNIGLLGSRAEIIRAFEAAGWHPADGVTVRSSIEIGVSVAMHRPYPSAPISSLYYEHRRQDLAFEREVGSSADQRHHVRLWRLEDEDGLARDIWLGAASFDRGVGFSHETGQITHHIGADLDAERAFLLNTLADAKWLTETFSVPGIGPTTTGHNGGGDRYFTDGQIQFGVLKNGAS